MQGELPIEFGTQDAAETYRQRLEVATRQMLLLQRRDRRFVRVRVTLFLGVIVLGTWLTADPRAALPFSITTAVLVLVMVVHRPTLHRLRSTVRIQQWYSSCLQRLTNHWRQLPESGEEFVSSEHSWSGDLDLFGPGSLFQKLCQCRTLPARRMLAGWMTEVPAAEVIVHRQQMAESLRNELDLRERLATIDNAGNWSATETTLNRWATESARPVPPWIVFLSAVFGVAGIVLLFMAAADIVDFSTLLLVLLAQMPLMLLARSQIKAVVTAVDSVNQALRQLSQILTELEAHSFDDPHVVELQQVLKAGGHRASAQIRSLSNRIGWLNNSLRNQFLIPFAWLFGLTVLLTDRIERWRVDYGALIPGWIEASAELEVLLTIGAWSFDNADTVIPEISDGAPMFTACELGHPLLSNRQCILNDVQLTQDHPLMLISGSNMSGKSTLLRSIGTNLVLTWCGGRVNARSMSTTPFQMGTVMRVSDSLIEGRSLFFSIVRRLRQVVDLTDGTLPVLFLLDEILNGTNSNDRRRGAEAVIRSLLDRGALGLVTTHDLELTRIVHSLDGRAGNYHFEDQITDGAMTFDYQLREGVVERSNAIELMRMMGLDV
ncbi:MAG: hypothetical protein MK102_14195 [Fuerstiella sp.]|nr:hypothetical protein [Fuerstiella sp.]